MSLSIHWDQLVSLNENHEDYEPPEEEIEEYAQYIGLVLPKNNKYLYLAREGLKAPLPPFWQPCEDANGNIYFRNRKTRKIVDTNPLDDLYRQKARELIMNEKMQYVQAINEVSAVNQSSGLLQSKLQLSSARINVKENQENQSLVQPQMLKNHITEQSQYSESEQNSIAQSGREEVQTKTYNTAGQNKIIADLKKRIEKFVPRKEELITNVQNWHEIKGNVMDEQKVKKLVDLRLQVQLRRETLKQLTQQKKRLQSLVQQNRLKVKSFPYQ